MMAELLVEYLDVIGPLLGLLLCILRRGKRVGGFWYVVAFLLLQLLANGIAKYLLLKDLPNIRVYQLNAFLSFIAAAGWFIWRLGTLLTPVAYKWIRITGLFTFFLLLYILWVEDIAGGLNSLSLTLTAFGICLLAMVYYLALLVNVGEESILHQQDFWIATAFFMYYCCCFFVFFSYKVLPHIGVKNVPYLWLVNNVLLFVCCCILAIASKQARQWILLRK